MHNRHSYVAAVLITLLCYCASSAPIRDRLESVESPKGGYATDGKKATISKTRLRATNDDDDGYAPEEHSSRHSRQHGYDFEEELHQEGLATKHDSKRTPSEKRSTSYRKAADSEATSSHSQNNTVSGFFHSLGRFFGFNQNRTLTSQTIHPSSEHDKRENAEAADKALEEERTEDQTDSKFLQDRRSAAEYPSVTDSIADKWREDLGTEDETDTSAKDRFEEDMDSARKALETEQVSAEVKEDSNDLLSESDLKDMVRLFRRLFASMESSLQAKAERQHKRTASRSSKTTSKLGTRVTQMPGTSEDGEDSEELVGKYSTGRERTHQSGSRDVRDELPDVRVALATAENWNKKRDAERRAKFIADSMEDDDGETPRKKFRYSSRAKVSGSEDDEEDQPADIEEDPPTSRGHPKSSPAYGSRKRLLKSNDSGDEDRRTLIERLVSGLPEIF